MWKLSVALVIATLVTAASTAQETKESVKKDVVKKEPVKQEPVKQEPVKKQPAANEPVKKKPAATNKARPKPAVTLKVGDSAPPLQASKWLQGDEVKGFESGKTYVVEFWATWCGPCIVMMPHLAEMQAQYKEQGVTFIGYTAQDPNNSEEKVTEFVKKRGPKLKYTFAYSGDRETYDAWMRAAGQGGIPCSFVVDKTGKVAFIGHPMYLDIALPKVLDGTWKGPAELEDLEKDVDAAFGALRGDDAEASLKALADFEDRRPALAKVPYFVGPKIGLLLKVKKAKEARAYAEDVMQRAIKQDDPTALRTVSAVMRTDSAKEDKECLALSMKAAEALLTTAGDKDVMALLNMAETHFATGEKAKAKEFGQKAIDAADTEGFKRSLERRVKAFDAEPKDK